MDGEIRTRQCPYCKEEIRADAIKCKHCRSTVQAEKPPHGGICPYCKEDIHPEAIKCKHCGSNLVTGSDSGDCEGCGQGKQVEGLPAGALLPRQAGPLDPDYWGFWCTSCAGGADVQICCRRFGRFGSFCWETPCGSGGTNNIIF